MRRLTVAVFVACHALASASAVSAQRTPLLTFSNADGSRQATIGARFDITAYVPGETPAWLVRRTDPFLSPRASLVAEAFLGSSFYALGELRADHAEDIGAGPGEIRLEQLFANFRAAPAVELRAGKFVSPFGDFPQRHGTASDPFIRPPLPYEWPTLITPEIIPGSHAGFQSWKDEPDRFRPDGVPPVWGVPYQVGAMAFGTAGDLSYRLALMNSAPSSVPADWNSISSLAETPSLVAALAYQFTAGLRAGLSFNHGPFMQWEPDGGTAGYGSDYMQTMAAASVSYAYRRLDLHGELLFDRWEMPRVNGTPTDVSWYVEGRLKLRSALFAAARVARMDFNSLEPPPGDSSSASAAEPWDYPVTRVQIGGGYPIDETFSLRAEYQWTLKSRPSELRDNLFSVQVRIDP